MPTQNEVWRREDEKSLDEILRDAYRRFPRVNKIDIDLAIIGLLADYQGVA
jgi:hypothetical protein